MHPATCTPRCFLPSSPKKPLCLPGSRPGAQSEVLRPDPAPQAPSLAKSTLMPYPSVFPAFNQGKPGADIELTFNISQKDRRSLTSSEDPKHWRGQQKMPIASMPEEIQAVCIRSRTGHSRPCQQGNPKPSLPFPQ